MLSLKYNVNVIASSGQLKKKYKLVCIEYKDIEFIFRLNLNNKEFDNSNKREVMAVMMMVTAMMMPMTKMMMTITTMMMTMTMIMIMITAMKDENNKMS